LTMSFLFEMVDQGPPGPRSAHGVSLAASGLFLAVYSCLFIGAIVYQLRRSARCRSAASAIALFAASKVVQYACEVTAHESGCKPHMTDGPIPCTFIMYARPSARTVSSCMFFIYLMLCLSKPLKAAFPEWSHAQHLPSPATLMRAFSVLWAVVMIIGLLPWRIASIARHSAGSHVSPLVVSSLAEACMSILMLVPLAAIGFKTLRTLSRARRPLRFSRLPHVGLVVLIAAPAAALVVHGLAIVAKLAEARGGTPIAFFDFNRDLLGQVLGNAPPLVTIACACALVVYVDRVATDEAHAQALILGFAREPLHTAHAEAQADHAAESGI